MNTTIKPNHGGVSRRSFVRKGAATGAAAIGLAAFTGAVPALAATTATPGLTDGDVAILQFLAAGELIEADLWVQYAELAKHNEQYAEALRNIEGDLDVYTADLGIGETSHANFINASLPPTARSRSISTPSGRCRAPQPKGLAR